MFTRIKKPAVFLDRDGTLIQGTGFLRCIVQIDFYPQAFSALCRLTDFVLFIVTNQSGIAMGQITRTRWCLARAMVMEALGSYGRPTPNASESLPSGCTPTVTTALTPALGGQLAAGPR